MTAPVGSTQVRAISDPANTALRIWRIVTLAPRLDGRPWAPGQLIALHEGRWIEAEGSERTLSQVTEILHPDFPRPEHPDRGTPA